MEISIDIDYHIDCDGKEYIVNVMLPTTKRLYNMVMAKEKEIIEKIKNTC